MTPLNLATDMKPRTIGLLALIFALAWMGAALRDLSQLGAASAKDWPDQMQMSNNVNPVTLPWQPSQKGK